MWFGTQLVRAGDVSASSPRTLRGNEEFHRAHLISIFLRKGDLQRSLILIRLSATSFPRCASCLFCLRKISISIYFRFFNLSMRPDTRSFAFLVPEVSRSISIIRISPSRQPGGRRETGRLIRAASSSSEIRTAVAPSIRSMVAFMITLVYDF